MKDFLRAGIRTLDGRMADPNLSAADRASMQRLRDSYSDQIRELERLDTNIGATDTMPNVMGKDRKPANENDLFNSVLISSQRLSSRNWVTLGRTTAAKLVTMGTSAFDKWVAQL